MADSYIYVTSKFLRPTQMYLNNMYTMLQTDRKYSNDASARRKKFAEKSDRIYVVHNLIEANDKEIMSVRVKETELCYASKVVANEDNWEIDSSSFADLTVYHTNKYTHIFMVNEPEVLEGRELTENEKWRLQHNKKCIDFLIQRLSFEGINTREFNLIEEFSAIAQKELGKYTYGYNYDDMEIVVDCNANPDGIPVLLPVKKEKNGSSPSNSSSALSLVSGVDYSSRYLTEGWALKEIQFTTDSKMITAEDLKGQIMAKYDDKDEISGFVVKVEMPGVVDKTKDIQIKRNRAITRLTISAKRTTLTGEEKLVNFIEDFDNTCCFSISPSNEEVLKNATLVNGIFTCEIPREISEA